MFSSFVLEKRKSCRPVQRKALLAHPLDPVKMSGNQHDDDHEVIYVRNCTRKNGSRDMTKMDIIYIYIYYI